jgi:hypothetical protein
MITLDKWYPMVYPTQQNIEQAAFERAAQRVEEEYKEALEANKIEFKTHQLEVELYDKKARQNTIELGMFEDRKRFQVFV